ncbi:Anaphase-promoting complex subunit 1, partial [Lunasporangiospora selenospora]
MEITILGRHKPLGYDCSNRTAPDSSAPDLRTPKSYNFSTSGGDTPLSDSSGTHAPQFQLYPPVSDGIVVDLLKNQAGLGEKEDCFIGYDTSTRGNPTGYDVELVITKYKVVWSQGLVLRKALDFSSEKDPVVQAFFSWFLVDSNTGNPTTDLAGPSIDPENNNHSGTKQHQSKPMADRCRRARRQALVVLFERNIKLFFHNGDTYLVHAPFACRRAWAMDLGLILERAVQKDEYGQAAYGIGLEVFYSLLDPLIEFRPVALEPARNAKETRATSSGPNRMMNESTHIRNVEIHNTIKFVSTDDKYIRIAITFDSNLLLHRVWRYFMNTNLDPLPLEIEETGSLADVDAEEQMMDDTRNDAPKMRRDIYFQEIKSLITSSSQESTVFIAHKMDGACVVCILDHEVGKLTCYELVKNTLAPLWVVLVSAASAVQATRKNQLDVLLSTPDHKLLLWTGFAGEFVPCHLNIHKALTHVSGDKKLGDDIRVVEIGDNVEDRVSFKLSNSMVLRARLDFMIRSSLVQQCLDALCFVLPLDLLWSFRHRFLQLHFSKDHRYADEPSMDEWGHFRTTLLSYCVQIPTTTVSSSKKFSRTRSPIPGEVSDGESDTEFLLESAIHSKLSNHPSFRRNPVSLPQPSKNPYREAIDRAQRHAALLSGGPVTRQAARIDPYICRILVALHLVHEDRSINVITAEERHLAQLLTLLSHIVRWHTWVDLYSRRSFACTLRFDLPGYEGICAVTSPQPDQFEFDPPDILDWITKVVSLDNTLKPFPTLRSLCLDRRPHIPSLFTKPCDQTRI